MNNLLLAMISSLALAGCTGTNMEIFENKKSKHKQKLEKLHQEAHKTETIIQNNNRKQNPSRYYDRTNVKYPY
jgi:hypothetical protein